MPLVYGAKLDTEGILFEIDQAKIIEWLRDNNIIREEQVPDLHDELAVKRWFAENVHGDLISMFGEIEGDEAITKNVFGLLHSMSHAFIQATGEISGLSSNSLTEIIFVETSSLVWQRCDMNISFVVYSKILRIVFLIQYVPNVMIRHAMHV